MTLDGNRISQARLALGGVAAKPWRNPEAEHSLIGREAGAEAFAAAADLILAEAEPQSQNAFKIPLARKAIIRALKQAADGTSQTIADKRIQ